MENVQNNSVIKALNLHQVPPVDLRRQYKQSAVAVFSYPIYLSPSLSVSTYLRCLALSLLPFSLNFV